MRILITVGTVLVGSLAYAMPMGGLSYMPESFSVSISILAGYQQQNQELIHNPEDVDDQGTSYSSYLGLKLGIYPADFVGFFGAFGTGDWRMTEIEYQSFLGINYAGGVAFKIFPWERSAFQTVLTLAVSGFQSSGSSHLEKEQRNDIESMEYQGSLLFSYAVERNIIPFGGIRYVAAYTRFSPRYQYNMSPSGKWGVQLGLDYFVTPYVFFAGEMQIFERTAVYLGVGLKY